MPWNNLTCDLTPANITTIKANIQSSRNLTLWLINMTDEERQTMSKMGDDGFNYVTRAIELAEANPNLIPAGISILDARKDLDRSNALRIVFNDLLTYFRTIEDTMIASGIEAKDTADTFYGLVKGLSKSNVPGAQAIYNELKPFYDRASQAPPPTP